MRSRGIAREGPNRHVEVEQPGHACSTTVPVSTVTKITLTSTVEAATGAPGSDTRSVPSLPGRTTCTDGLLPP